MRDDEKLFSFGLQFFILALIAISAFHAVFSQTDRDLSRRNRTMASLEQDLANSRVRFAALVQPDILRPIVMRLYPNYKPVGTGRTINTKNMNDRA